MYKILFTFSFIFYSIFSWSQNDEQEKLEKRKAQIQNEIRAQQNLMKSKNHVQRVITKDIEQQSKKIRLGEQLINVTEKQSNVLKKNIQLTQSQINRLVKELAILKEDYAEMILKSYKGRSEQSRAMFLLSSQDFLQAYKRAQYMKQYANFRREQGLAIASKTNQLEDYNGKLDEQKEAKLKIIAEQEKAKQLLEADKKEKEKMVQSILKDKKKIAQEIKRRQQETRAIDRQINRLIREAIAEANRRAAAAARAANPGKVVTEAETKALESSAVIVLTPEAKIIADNFKANRGKLPWPVEKGRVYSRYGNQPHPVYSSLMIHNSGIDIETSEGATARAVFGGTVTKVIVLSPVNKAVFIQHGDYFTVYQNLSSVNVSKGDNVGIKEALGKVRTNGDSGKTILKFMILQNTVPNNPSSWIVPM
jgi:murein hydrolase activator